jgi:hypothetical protein
MGCRGRGKIHEPHAPHVWDSDACVYGPYLCNDYPELEQDMKNKPEIVVLCGSTRFKSEFNTTNARLTLQGKIVISVGVFVRSNPPYSDVDPGAKERLDELHKRKIDLADRVMVINPGGYIGSSTRGEIEYALGLGLPVDYLEA